LAAGAQRVSRRARHCGSALIEIVISIVIVAIAVAGILVVLSANARTGADVMIREQAVAIGDAYLEEIMLKSYDDPDGVTGESSRALFDDVSDYSGLNDSNGARDQLGNLIGGLDKYLVAVAVTTTTLGSIPAKRIDVTVTYSPAIEVSGATAAALKFTGYRTNY
jgi:MSHA pilin protein MshD